MDPLSAPRVEVELDEQDGPAERAPVPRWLILLLAAALLVAAVGWLVTSRVEAARRADLLAARGFVPSLGSPVGAAWRGPALSPLLDDGERLLGTSGEVLRAVDLATGAELWSRDPHADCVPVVDGELPGGLGPVAARGRTTVLWCQERGAPVADVVLDPVDGAELARVTTPGDPLLATVLDGDVVRLSSVDGRLTWQRWSLDGELLWQDGTQDVVIGDALPTVSVEAGGAYAAVIARRTVVVDLATGAEVDPVLVAAGGTEDRRVVARSIDLPGGAVAQERVGTGLLPRVVVVGPDGTARWSTSGELARPLRDDGSAADLVLVRSGGVLTALDAVTGDRRWSYTDPVSPALLAGGVLVAQGGGDVVALDLGDGAVLWQAPLAGAARAMVLAGSTVTSDGTLVLAQDGADLAARGLRDGQVRWRVPVPDGAQWSVVLVDGSLVVGDQGAITALR